MAKYHYNIFATKTNLFEFDMQSLQPGLDSRFQPTQLL